MEYEDITQRIIPVCFVISNIGTKSTNGFEYFVSVKSDYIIDIMFESPEKPELPTPSILYTPHADLSYLFNQNNKEVEFIFVDEKLIRSTFGELKRAGYVETKTLYLIVNKDISLVGAGDFEVSIETELICDELPDPVLNNFSITVHFFCN